MPDTPLIKIGTHDGPFHADDVLAMAMLTTIFAHHQVIRTRDETVLELCDLVIDVGGKYDHRTRRYDHHMPHPPRDYSGHLFSSAGLVWGHYAKTYLRAIGIPKTHTHKGVEIPLLENVEYHIKKRWIIPIDRGDNGINYGPTPISELVMAMQPIKPERSGRRFDSLFLETVGIVSNMFKRTCFHAADRLLDYTYLELSEPTFINEGKIVVSEVEVRSIRSFTRSPAHFVIYTSIDYSDGSTHYIIRPIMREDGSGYKTTIPNKYKGLTHQEENTLLPEGILFVHHSGFMAKARDEQSAVSFCTRILNEV